MVKVQKFVGPGCFFIFSLFPSFALAYYSLGESGNLVGEDTYEIGFSPRITPDKVSMSVFFDFPTKRESSFRCSVGAGDSFFFLAVSSKEVSSPHHKSQLDVGVKLELMHVDYSGIATFFIIRLMPLISTNLSTSNGLLTPYFSLPASVSSSSARVLLDYAATNKTEEKTNLLLQATAGSEFRSKYYLQWKFGGELGFNIYNSPDYVMPPTDYVMIYATYLLGGKNLPNKH